MKRGFDSKVYLAKQSFEIEKRIKCFQRLYLEVGGKLYSDDHAARVLPGYDRKNKIKILRKLRPLEVIYCMNSKDIDSNRRLTKKLRTYSKQVLIDLKNLKKEGLRVSFIVITRYSRERETEKFKEELEKRGYAVMVYPEIKDYTESIAKTLGAFDERLYIPVKEKLVIVTGPAGNSGKMSIALSQIYHEKKRKKKTGFAKFETFPVHDLALEHPINLAYEAATADLGDKNEIDPYHKRAYRVKAVNYNRDINNFKILRKIFEKITHEKNPFGYKSPTDMGINEIKEGIIDDSVCRRAAIKEIFNRLKRYKKERRLGREKRKTILRILYIINSI